MSDLSPSVEALRQLGPAAARAADAVAGPFRQLARQVAPLGRCPSCAGAYPAGWTCPSCGDVASTTVRSVTDAGGWLAATHSPAPLTPAHEETQ